MSRRASSLTLARRAAQVLFLVLFVLLVALARVRGEGDYNAGLAGNYSPVLLGAFWHAVRAAGVLLFVLLVSLAGDQSRAAGTRRGRRLWQAVTGLLMAAFVAQDAAALWQAAAPPAQVSWTLLCRGLQAGLVPLFLLLLAARPLSTRHDRKWALRLARGAALAGIAASFVFLDMRAMPEHAGHPTPPLQAFFWFDPLLLLATWLSVHAVPVAFYAVPGLIALIAAALVLRKWVFMAPLLLLVLLALAGTIAVTAWTIDARGATENESVLLQSSSAVWTPLPSTLLLALGTILATMVLGRVFCGWICPLGTVHAIAGRVLRGAGKVASNRAKDKRSDCPTGTHWSPWQRAKYYVLVGMLAMALLGGHWGTIFDPLVLLYRTTTIAVLPAVQWAVGDSWKAVYDAEPSAAPEPAEERLADVESSSQGQRPAEPPHTLLYRVTDPVYEFLRNHVFPLGGQVFLGSGAIVAFFLVTLALNAWRPRFWCRYVCPLGALLGLCAWRPLLRRSVEKEGCNGCGLCGATCHGASAEGPGEGWKAAECLGCFNCGDACARGALKFHWNLPLRGEPSAAPVDLSKRATLLSALGGVAALAMLRVTPEARRKTSERNLFHARLIRPPGAREESEFLARCTACGLCMKACPTGGLQPCWDEAGLEGLWTPRLVSRIGYCHDGCATLCGQACPTGAIQALTLEQKKQTKIGLAAFDTTRCLPYAYGRSCTVCEECCPVANKAIYCIDVEIVDRDGNKTTILQPRVDPNLCTGCGLCENVCPLKDSPGVRVFSANETRNPNNQPILW